MKKKKVLFLGLQFAHDCYYSSHKKVLKKNYDIVSISFDESPFISKVFKRRSFLTLPLEVLYLVVLLFRVRPEVVISIGPKVGLISTIVSRLLFVTNYHWFTGQVWANKSKKWKSAAFWGDAIIYHLASKLLSDGKTQASFLNSHFRWKRKIFFPEFGSINGIPNHFYKTIPIRKPSEILKICYVGRKANEKGFPVIYEILTKCEELNIKVNMVLAGPVDIDSTEYEVFIKNPKTLSNFTLLDSFVNPLDIFQESDILILPSEREGFGSVVIEAQSQGLPVICSDVYGLKDAFINGKSGVSCGVKNIDDYLHAIIKLSNKDVYEEYSHSAIQFAKNFKEDEFIKSLELVYKEVGVL